MSNIAYLRSSTDEQALGLATQLDIIRAAIGEPAVVFQDEGISGASNNRPGLHAAINALSSGSVLVVARRDRLARDLMLSCWIEKEVKRRGARILSAAGEGTESDDPASRLLRNMIDAFAQYERELIGERSKAALAVKRSRGEATGGHVPFGYQLGFDGKYLQANEGEARAVALMVELHRRGLSLRKICTELEKRGIPTKTGKSRWHPQVVRRIIKQSGVVRSRQTVQEALD